MGTVTRHELWLSEPSPFEIQNTSLNPEHNWATQDGRFRYAGVVYRNGIPYSMVQHMEWNVGGDLNDSWVDTSQTVTIDQEGFRQAAADALASPTNPNPDISYILVNAFPTEYGADLTWPPVVVPLQSPYRRQIRAWIDVRSKVDPWGAIGSLGSSAKENVIVKANQEEIRGEVLPQISDQWSVRSVQILDQAVAPGSVLPINSLPGAYNGKQISAQMFVAGEYPWGTYHLSHVLFRMEVETFDEAEATPYRRVFPRHDGLAGGAGRNYPPSRAIQSSNRIGGGYL